METSLATVKDLDTFLSSPNTIQQIARSWGEQADAPKLALMLKRLAITAASKNPKLLDCTPASIGLALCTAAQLGVYPNGRDAYLIPYKRECQLQIGYMGLCALLHKHNPELTIEAEAVRQNDDFAYQYGTNSFLRHVPGPAYERGELTHAYAIITGPRRKPRFLVLDKEQILKRAAVAQTDKVWKAWPEPMWQKTAAKAIIKMESVSMHVLAAIEHDNEVSNDLGKAAPERRPELELLDPDPAEPPANKRQQINREFSPYDEAHRTIDASERPAGESQLADLQLAFSENNIVGKARESLLAKVIGRPTLPEHPTEAQAQKILDYIDNRKGD